MKAKLLVTAAIAVCASVTAHGQDSTDAITTVDGRTYHDVNVLRTELDGLLVRFEPEGGGLGLAKLKFRNLSEAMQTQYGYNPEQAVSFQERQAEAQSQWLAQQRADDSVRRFRDLVLLSQSLSGDALTRTAVSLSPDGTLSAHSESRSIPVLTRPSLMNAPYRYPVSPAVGPTSIGGGFPYGY